MSQFTDNPATNLPGPAPADGQPARTRQVSARYRAKESLWVRLSLVVGVMVVSAVAIFMLPKIAGRSSGMQTKADVRTKLWQQELVDAGRVTRDLPDPTDRRRDVAIIAGLVGSAAMVVAAMAYAALRPRSAANSVHAETACAGQSDRLDGCHASDSSAGDSSAGDSSAGDSSAGDSSGVDCPPTGGHPGYGPAGRAPS